jgi:hypothetical protein
MTHKINKISNTVKFGSHAICLGKSQLAYYYNGSLMKVREVSHMFTPHDLFELATKISTKNNFGPVEFTSRETVIKKY